MNSFAKELSKYTGFAVNGMKSILAYRISALAWSFLPILFLLVQYYLWMGIFQAGGGSLYRIDWRTYLTYIGIGFLSSRFTNCPFDMYIAGELKNGNVAMNLLKPFSYQGMIFARHLGEKAVYILQILPMLLVVLLLTRPVIADGWTWGAWGMSLLLSFLLNFVFSFLIGTFAFWITNVWGLGLIRNALRFVFSGDLLAISLFFQIGEKGITLKNMPLPHVNESSVKGFFHLMGVIAYCLPFQAMFYTPTGIYTGMIRGTRAVALHLGIQFAWIVLLFGGCALLWKRAMKRITIMGG